MELRAEQVEAAVIVPRTLRFCEHCQKETPHEVRTAAGIILRLCIPCLEESLQYELDRD